MTRAGVVAMVLVPGCCAGTHFPDEVGAERWYQADALFHRDAKWLGGDGATSVVLDSDRTLWLFGDSFIATTPAHTRRESVIVHNSVALMTGHDPLSASMEFAWRRGPEPGPLFADIGDHWLRPMSGVRIPGGPLIVFLAEVARVPLGEATVGTRAMRIADPSGPPETWTIEPLDLPPAPWAIDTLFAPCATIDGDHLVAIAVEPPAYGHIVRWPAASLARGDLRTREWRDASTDAWIAETDLDGGPTPPIRDAAQQCSLTPHPDWQWIYMEGRKDKLHYRASDTLETWVDYDPEVWLTDGDTFVHPVAAAVQPSIVTDEEWLGAMTFVDSSDRFADLVDEQRERTLFWPHVAHLIPVQTSAE